MKLSALTVASLLVAVKVNAAESNFSEPKVSHLAHPAHPSTFKPPQVFKNVNLLRNINLEKGYVKETINVVIENIDTTTQSEYYVPFQANAVDKVGGLEARDKKDLTKSAFKAELVEYDPLRYDTLSVEI